MTQHAATVARPRRQPVDQAHGLRQLFAGSRQRFVPLVHNPHVGFGGVVMERLCTAFAGAGLRTLVVDAADTASAPHELAAVDLAACIERLSPSVGYLAARGLPMRYLDHRASTAGFLQALSVAAPQADIVLVHAGASDLRRLFSGRAPRPVLMAGLRPDSLTEAYAAMKLLGQRLGPLTYDTVVVGDMSARRARQTAERLAQCADHFLGAAIGCWAVVDPTAPARAAVSDDLHFLAQAQLPQERPSGADLGDAGASHAYLHAAAMPASQPGRLN
ncbi:flagellar biosynthesis protein [Ideonella sp. DXS22W]|uniref:Flagellar biosynthesis protein n=1 Tax=Pseudaquabacterium inlustre TaxID=2984192 RepID=A0ABU9CF26_9BURK